MIPVSVLLVSLAGMGLQSGFIFADWRRKYKLAAVLKGLSAAAPCISGKAPTFGWRVG